MEVSAILPPSVTIAEIKTAAFLAHKAVQRGSRSTAALLVFVISLSFLNMLFVSGMLFGLQRLMVRSVIDLFSGHVTVSAQQEPRVKATIPDQASVRAEIETIDGVEAAVRHYQLAGSISFDRLKNGVYRHISGPLVGIDPEEERRVLAVDRFLIDGAWLEPTDRDHIVLSSALAGGYGVFAPSDLGGVRVGDKVRITYANGVSRQYTVKGIYNDAIGLFETFITTDEAESVLGTHNQASQILVRGDLARASVEVLARRIQAAFPKLKVQPYTVLLGSFDAFLRALDFISAIVSAISIVVAAITMFALFFVNTASKRRQIGVLMAIGIDRRAIVLSYVLQSLFYGACGVLLGAAFVFGLLVPAFAAHPIDVVFGKLAMATDADTTLAAVVGLIAASVLAGFVPSLSATKGDILKALSR